MCKDAFGNELLVGDKVLYATVYLGFHGFMIAEIIKTSEPKWEGDLCVSISVLPLKSVVAGPKEYAKINNPNKTRTVYAANCIRLDHPEEFLES